MLYGKNSFGPQFIQLNLPVHIKASSSAWETQRPSIKKLLFPKSQNTKINKWDYIKFKRYYSAKGKENNQQSDETTLQTVHLIKG
jgi:hypothetical protein